ncbi:MAG: thioredoxin family protein [Salinivirgaceae bacterium]|nr:thioredoxin family protein [Salinivirgaceae bacterium]
MKKIKAILLLTLIAAATAASAQTTIVEGSNRTYRNQKIEAYACTDYISGANTLVGSTVADSLGKFKLALNITRTCRVTLKLGRANGILYADTAMTYTVLLPDFEPLSKSDKLNPYFTPDEFLVGIKNPDRYNLNMYVDLFDYTYQDCLERNYYRMLKNPDKQFTDSLIETMETSFDSIPNEFFSVYRQYKYAWLKFISYMRDWRYMSREYFDNQPIEYENPAYMDLFNQTFTNFLRMYMNTREGERIYSDVIMSKSPVKAKQTLSNCLAVTNDTLQEMVLLKSIHDALYDYYFRASSLLITLDSIKNTTKIDQHKCIAENIEQKNAIAKAGTAAPAFCLADTAGVYRSVDEFCEKYIYLNFISLDSYACTQSLEQLRLMNEKTKDVIQVVSISIDEDFDKVKKYFKRNHYNWMLLDYKADPTVLDRYKVKAYPSYYLIDTEGNLCMSPAASPSEDFEKRFLQYYRDQQKNRQ